MRFDINKFNAKFWDCRDNIFVSKLWEGIKRLSVSGEGQDKTCVQKAKNIRRKLS